MEIGRIAAAAVVAEVVVGVVLAALDAPGWAYPLALVLVLVLAARAVRHHLSTDLSDHD